MWENVKKLLWDYLKPEKEELLKLHSVLVSRNWEKDQRKQEEHTVTFAEPQERGLSDFDKMFPLT